MPLGRNFKRFYRKEKKEKIDKFKTQGRPLEQSLSQWNKFKRTYQDYKLFFKFNILIETNQLGQFQLSKERIKRLELIYSLHKTGYTNREISDFLNRKKLKTFRTNKHYTSKLIYMTIKKYKNRLSRNKSRLISLREGLYVTPMNKYIDK